MKKKKGMFWHVHHDVLVEYCHGYQERVDFINEFKLPNEVHTRLKLFQPVKGKLPDDVVKAREACNEAREAYDEAREAHQVEITALHEKECPDCIWDGEELDFSKGT